MSTPLSFRAILDNRDYISGINEMNKETNNFSSNVSTETQKIQDQLGRLGRGIAVGFSVSIVTDFVKEIVRVRSEFQQLEIAFSTMLGGKAAADSMMSEIMQIATTTPYGMQDVAEAVKMLLAYGSSAKTVRDEINMLGDIASGVGAPLKDIVYLYGTLRTQGKAYAQDIRQFAGRGIPIYAELAKVLKTTEGQVSSFVEAGKVGFKDVEQAFKNMTSGSGQFAGLMKAQSNSIKGDIERLGDALDVMKNEIGKSNEGIINGSIAAAATLVENYEAIGKALGGLIVTYGVYKAALIALSVVEKVRAGMMVTENILKFNGGMMVAATTTRSLTAAQSLNNIATAKAIALQKTLIATIRANPFLAIASVLLTVAASIWAYTDSTTEAEKVQKKLNEELEKGKELAEEYKAALSGNIGILQDDNSTELQKVKAYEQLMKIAPKLTAEFSKQEIALLGTADAQKLVNEQVDKNDYENLATSLDTLKKRQIELNNEIQNHAKRIADLDYDEYDKILSDLKEELAVNKGLVKEKEKLKKAEDELREKAEYEIAPTERKLEILQKQANELEAQKRLLEGQKNPIKDILGLSNQVGISLSQWRIDSLADSIEYVRKKMNELTNGALNNPKTFADFEAIKKTAEENFKKSIPGTAEFKKYKAEVEAASKELDKWSMTAKRSGKVAKEIFDPNSLAGINQQIKAIEDVIEKIPISQKAKIEALQADLIALHERRVEAESVTEIKSFDDLLKEKKEKYIDFQSLLFNSTSEVQTEAAKSMFSDLMKEGANYAEYIKSQLETLQPKFDAGELNTADLAKYLLLIKELNVVQGKSTGFDILTKRINQVNENFDTSTEKILEYRKILDELMNMPLEFRNADWEAQVNNIGENIERETKAAKNSLKSFLVSVVGSEQRRLSIVKKYADLRASATDQADISIIDEAEKQELADFYFEAAVMIQKLDEHIIGSGRKAMQAQIAQLKQLAEARKRSHGEADAEYKAYLQRIKEGQESLFDNDLQFWGELSRITGEVTQNMEDLPGVIGHAASFVSQLAGQFDNIANTISSINKGDKQGAIAGAANGVGGLIGLIVSGSKNRKARKKKEEVDSLQMQLDLNMALIEEMRLRGELSSNFYVDDYYGRIRASIEAMTLASEKAFDVIKKLSKEGKVMNGLTNKLDWGAVGAGAASGVSIGLAVGSIIPGVGNAIGAVIGALAGAITGLFAGMKKDARYSGLFEIYPELIDGQGNLNKALAEALIANDRLDEKTKQYLQNLIDINEEWQAAKDSISKIAEDLTGALGSDIQNALVDAFKAGEDAARAFADTTEKTIEKALEQLIFSKVFNTLFDQLGQDMESALLFYGQTGDLAGVYDAFAKFMQASQGAVGTFEEIMKAAQEYGKQFDFDLWNPDDTKDEATLKGAIKGVSEETANKLTGLINGMAQVQIQNNQVLNNQLISLNFIASMARYNIYLESIDRRLATQNNESWNRATGF